MRGRQLDVAFIVVWLIALVVGLAFWGVVAWAIVRVVCWLVAQ